MEYKNQIRNYIHELTSERITDDSTNLFEAGLLTSLDVMDLISFIEHTFEINLSEDDIDMESFSSVEKIACLVEKIK